MTGPIIPAGQWPEHAHAIVWDSDGQSLELRLFGSDWGLVFTQPRIDMPAGHDWRVPVMRPTVEKSSEVAPAIDLEQFRPVLEYVRLSIMSEEKREEIDRLFALTDRQARDNGVRVGRSALQMAINVLRRAGKHEVADALAGGVIDGQSVSEKPQKRRCPNNAAPGGCQLPNRFCTFPDCEKADKLLPTKGEGVDGE